jgi:hypothetical protein
MMTNMLPMHDADCLENTFGLEKIETYSHLLVKLPPEAVRHKKRKQHRPNA